MSAESEASAGTADGDGTTREETDEETVLSIDEVDVQFDQGGMFERMLTDNTVSAVDDVSVDIGENDVVALVGESGCGKTTLGKTAVGLQQPTNGSVNFRGQDVWEAKRDGDDAEIPFSEVRRSLQIVHQDPTSSLNPGRTVLATLSDPLKRWRPDLAPHEREEQVYTLLERVGMTPVHEYASRYPGQLSGGEKQRIALGRALLMEPDLILADEAVSALDVSLRIEMMDLMLELQDVFDTSYLFISHDLANARYLTEKVGGRIGIMYLGKLVEIGTPQEIIHNPKHPYTKVMLWSTPALDPEIAEETADQAPPVRQIDVPDPADPPSGCRFHTRCPEAREVCQEVEPERLDSGEGDAACFRVTESHRYWQSPPIELDEELS